MSAQLPSHFGTPFVTTIPSPRFDSKGRQLSFVESDVQRLERLAFLNGSQPRSASPASSSSSVPQSPSQSPVIRAFTSSSASPSSSPSSRPRLIQGLICDPIELMANQLAEEFLLSPSSSDDSSDDDYMMIPNLAGSSPPSYIFANSVPAFADISRKAPRAISSTLASSSFKPGHRRKRSELFAIREED
ncbi:hypothetical protein BJ165DRAFT_1522774 [Panaeolus papilionaceus]|nr:hypothetical protein BJ165DRAFT_1522774 [Panaeolus papilionaceus]